MERLLVADSVRLVELSIDNLSRHVGNMNRIVGVVKAVELIDEQLDDLSIG